MNIGHKSRNEKPKSQAVNWGGRSLNLLLTLALVLGLLGPVSIPTVAQAANLHPLLAQLAVESPEQTVAVIVQKAETSKRAEELVVQLGGAVTKDLRLINAFAAELSADAARQLAASPGVRWVSLDAPMQSSAVGDPTVRDEFSVASFNNNNGTNSWAAGWTETGDGSSSATSGYVKIASGQLQFSSTNRKLSRPANLAGATSATLSFQYKRNGLDNASDYIAVEVSANGGASWTELARYMGPGTDSTWKTASFNILSYAASNTTIRFATSSSLGSSDYLYVDNVQIEYVVPPAGASDGTVSTGALLNAYNQAIGADKLWAYGYQGSSVTVAVVDSGITDQEDFKEQVGGNGDLRIRAVAEFVQGSDIYKDRYGHGTHVAGIIAGNGSKSYGRYIGVAPKVNLVSVDVANEEGAVTMSDIIAGAEWVLNNKAAYNIRVVNISTNSSVAESCHTSPLCAAVEILWFNGIVVVVSAGNNGTAALYPPANDPFVITAGATDDMGTPALTDDALASFSAYGLDEAGRAKPDLVAPGRNIISTLAKQNAVIAITHPENMVYTFPGSQDLYFRMSGTSMSAPVVSGAVALLLQDEPNLTPDQVKYRLMATANKNWPGYNATTAGAGYLDIYAAVIGTTTQSANTNLVASQLLWTGSNPVSWGSVNWNSVNWNSVNWNSVNWNSVNWNSVNWNSDYWGP
jgi:serine protease AprX